MSKTLLLFVIIGSYACGQQTEPKQTAAGRALSTHTAAQGQKGQIIQPEIRAGNGVDASSLLISFHGCADLLLTDPHGRKLGYDADSHKNYSGIAGGTYDEGNEIDDDDDDQNQEPNAGEMQPGCITDKTIQFPNPVFGTYTLKIGGQTHMEFKLEITSYGPDAQTNGHYRFSQLIGSSAHLTYKFQLPLRSDTRLQVKDSPKNTNSIDFHRK